MDRASSHTASPSVSIIIPAGDSHKTIKDTIDSVLSQSYPSIEIITVLNGNPGSTTDIVKSYSGITVLTIEEANAFKARRYGASHSHGDYIFFIDADDCLEPDAIEIAVRKAEETSADIVQLKLVQFIRKLGVMVRWKFPCQYDSANALKGILCDSSIYNPGMSGKLYRRSLIMPFPEISYHGFWGEDRLFNMYIFERNPVAVYASDAVYLYRYGGMSRNMTRKELPDEIFAVHKLKLEYLALHDLQRYLPDVEKEYAELQEIIRSYNNPSGLLRLKLFIRKIIS